MNVFQKVAKKEIRKKKDSKVETKKATTEEAVVVATTTDEVAVVVAETDKKSVQILEEAKTEELPKLGKDFTDIVDTANGKLKMHPLIFLDKFIFRSQSYQTFFLRKLRIFWFFVDKLDHFS